MTPNVTVLDVRAEFRAGQHPCDKIQNALRSVGQGEALRLLVPFEPLPLYEIARDSGLAHEARQISGGDWEVLFSPSEAVKESAAAARSEQGCGCGCHASPPTEILDLDARQLEPPQPMVKILEALRTLPNGAELHARTDRRPIHLYPVLESRGYIGQSEQQPDGSYLTYIRRT